MGAEQSLRSGFSYGRALVKNGVSGLSTGRDVYLHGRPLCEVLSESARASLGLTTLGACAGLLRYFLPARRGRVTKTAAYGLAGAAIGFAAGFAWRTRGLTQTMTHSAAKRMSQVRDEHWLARHPIDYA